VLTEEAGHTRDGDVMGTPAYMAPEQAAGKIQEIGPACDVYSLGVLLYEVLTGRVPLQGPTTLDTLLRVRNEEPVPPRRLQSGVPRDLETICLHCLEKKPALRYASAGELADDLRRFQEGRPIAAKAVGPWERAWKWARRRPAVAALAAVSVTLFLFGFVLVTGCWLRAEGEADQARRAEGEAESRRRRAEEAEARLALAQGQALCEQGEVGRGLLWLARGLEQATSAGAASLDRPLRVNLAAWGRQLRPPGPRLPNPAPVLGMSFDPTGRFVLAGGKDGFIHHWDVQSGREVGPPLEVPRPTPHTWVSVVEFSPDGRTLAAAATRAVVLWDPLTRRRAGEPLPLAGMLWGLAFLPDGKRLAAMSDEGTAVVWDLAGRRVVLGPLTHDRAGGYYTLAVSPDGRTLVTAGQDGRALRWDLSTGQPVGHPLQHDACVMAAVFTRDGRKLLTSTRGGSLYVWDLATGRATDLPRQGTEAPALALAPDGRLFATATGFGIVRLWQADSLRPVGPVFRCEAGVHALAFSPDGRRLAMGMEPDGIAVAELPPSLDAAAPGPPLAEVHAVAYSPDGGRLLAGTRNGAVWLDPATGNPVGERLVNREGFRVEDTALGPDGRTVVTGRWSGVLGAWRGRTELWDAATGKLRWQTPDQATQVTALALGPDGRTVFSCGRTDEPGGGALWGAATGDRVRPLLATLGRVRVRRAAFHPGGALLLACDDGRVRLWDVSTDTERTPDRPLTHPGAVTALVCERSGARVLTGCRDGTAWLWDLEKREPLLAPLRHEAEVSAVAFSPACRTLLTGSLDGAARFWDAGSGQPLGPTLWHDGPVRAVAYRPDGSRVAAAGQGGRVYQWHVPAAPLDGTPEQVRSWAEALTGLRLDEQGAAHKPPVVNPRPDVQGETAVR
jgi:WD40 repeat protein